jgi:phosphoserine phosphatase RsbU/P
MTTVPLPKSTSQPPVSPGIAGGELAAPVVALKELVARLNREQNYTQDLLGSLGFALRSFHNLNQFLELIPQVASRLTKADGGALMVMQPDGELRLERFHFDPDQPSYDQHNGPLRQALEIATQQFSQEDRPGLTHNESWAGQLDSWVTHAFGPGVKLFGTAILQRTLERGRLYVFSYSPTYEWTESRQKLVRFVADQTAVALEHDELESELRQKQRLDRELEIGAEIQRQLLPRTCPTVDGITLAARCETANRVGGDYYDFIPTRNDASLSQRKAKSKDPWGIAIGDVMGKGVPAGLIMTMLRGMLRAEVLNGHPPARILQHLNRVMYSDLENSNRFVTLFYSVYDPETRILKFSNAAHNPPLLWRFASQSLHRLDSLGMLVGLEHDSHYEGGQVKLEPGDVVIYYTDGFTDAASSKGDRFDEDNLIRTIQWACQRYDDPKRILDTLFDRVQQFIGPTKRNEDDMTLVVLKANLPS